MILDRFRLDGRVAIITGAGRGLGAAIALGFAEAGADVVIAARTEADLREVAAQVAAAGRQAHVVVADLADLEAAAALADAAVTRFGRLDIVVNNVGGAMPKPLLDTDAAELAEAFTFNVGTAHSLVHAAVPKILETAGTGSIINITSTMGRLPGRAFAAYATAKAALAHYTRSAAMDLCPRIRVNAIAPDRSSPRRCPSWRATTRCAASSNRPPRCAASEIPSISPRRHCFSPPRGRFPDRQGARGRRRPHRTESRHPPSRSVR